MPARAAAQLVGTDPVRIVKVGAVPAVVTIASSAALRAAVEN
jgi:hypothetical protein